MKRIIDSRINTLRAICIILVVFAHSIIAYNGSWATYRISHSSEALKYICNFIYLFHMPLFFSISGYLFWKGKNFDKFSELVKKKAIRLLIPFLLVGVLYMIPIRFLSNYPGYDSFLGAIGNLVIGRDSGHLWFLPALFIIFIVQYIITKYVKNRTVQDALIGIAFVAGSFVPLYAGKALQNIMWFHIGYRVNEKKTIGKKRFGWLMSVLFLMSSFLYFLIPESIAGYYYISLALKTFVAFLSIMACYNIISDKPSKLIGFISKYSFGVYLFHSPLIYITFCYLSDIEPTFMAIINFFGLGMLALLISVLVSKSRLRFIMGMTCQKAKN